MFRNLVQCLCIRLRRRLWPVTRAKMMTTFLRYTVLLPANILKTRLYSLHSFHFSSLFSLSLSPKVGIFYREVLDEAARTRLIENMAGHLKNAAEFIQKRTVCSKPIVSSISLYTPPLPPYGLSLLPLLLLFFLLCCYPQSNTSLSLLLLSPSFPLIYLPPSFLLIPLLSQVENFTKADPEYGSRLAKALEKYKANAPFYVALRAHSR